MRYQGGKQRTAKYIAALLPEADVYVEPFLGGGSVAAAVAITGKHRKLRLSDGQRDLFLLWRAVLDDWTPPDKMSREEYEGLRRAEPSALRGWAAFAASHSGKFFGGYGTRAESAGRDYLAEAQRLMLRKARALRAAEASLECVDYEHALVNPGDVVYCDPPYSTGESYAGMPPFDSARFWRTVDGWESRGAVVFVSEFAAPEGYESLLSVERAATLDPSSSKTTTEGLYRRAA